MPSQETADSFFLERRPLCPPAFVEERLRHRLRKRLLKSASLPPPVILRGLMSEEDVRKVYAFVDDLKNGMAFHSHPDVSDDALMVGVVAAMGGKVERDGDALLTGGQVGTVERVRLLSGGEARVLPDGPRAGAVHGGEVAALVRVDT